MYMTIGDEWLEFLKSKQTKMVENKHSGKVTASFANGYLLALLEISEMFIKELDRNIKMECKRR